MVETTLKTLIERFRSKPEWQHPDPAVRAEAVLRLSASERDVVLVDGEVGEAPLGLVPHRGVRVRAGDPGEGRRVGEPLHRRPAHARVGVLAGEGEKDLALGGGQAQHGLRADGGVGVLPLGLAAEPFDERLQCRLHQGGLRTPDYTPRPRADAFRGPLVARPAPRGPGRPVAPP